MNKVSWEAAATKLFAIEQKNLNPTNEMRSLFGNIALETSEARPAPQNQRRREVNLQGGVDLATALTGRYSMVSRGKELGTLATRRNCFMQGKKEWPLATSGGLSMETLPGTGESFEKQFKIIHNQAYSDVQMHFRMTVESMQAERMIGLLTANPYHIATLLQVSEIAKHQGDHSVSGDLLERALFTIGRSVHSSFPAAMREGFARLDFNQSANRELYLTIWRYIRNLEMRGTWRTAFEWAKVLLQFNTLSDPYGITLMIDQLALRGRQHAQLLELASDEGYGNAWQHLPNIQISLALAYLKSQKPRDARRQLAIAMTKYPYILSALASALDIMPIPKSLWGKLPSTDAEKLYTELYVTQAKDLWNTPEHTTLIAEVAETLEHYKDAVSSASRVPKLEISLEEARHIMLLEIPSLIALLPRNYTNMPTSSSDVLPPPGSISDFTARAPSGITGGPNALQGLFAAAGNAAGAPIQGANSVMQRILNWFQAPAATNGDATTDAEGEAAFRNLREQLEQDNGGREVTDEMVNELLQMHLSGADEGIDLAGLGMAGAWDYYEDAAEAPSDYGHNDDSDSMPELEDVTDNEAPRQPANPYATTVEEEPDSDEERQPQRSARDPGRSILRRVESDEEIPAPRATAPTTTASTPSTTASQIPSTQQEDDINTTTDPQRLQRWLITTGLSNLQSSPSDSSVLNFYVERLKILRKQQQDWIVNMVQQRAGKEMADRVRAASAS
jgi:tetratricopeptide (TPR) repeat protein